MIFTKIDIDEDKTDPQQKEQGCGDFWVGPDFKTGVTFAVFSLARKAPLVCTSICGCLAR